ncbi:MAG: class I SAM-dependent rRNA methyltransferase [Anaerolineales bacterium]|nr:class I SAM-dependent rRNA methyltransferase [Anaerolineales bacterium]
MDGHVNGTVVLKQGRAKPALQRHPWVFSGAIERIEGAPTDGDIVDVRDAGNNWLARGYLNRQSQIVVRLLTWHQDQAIDADFWRRRLAQAVSGRHRLAGDPSTTAYRLVHAESDYLPGLVVDRYGDWLAVQFLTQGVERWRAEIVSALVSLVTPKGVYERSDVDVREREGLPQRRGLVWGEEPPEQIEIVENGHRLPVDVHEGQKTGAYLDQRENRARLAPFCLGADVLDAFSYTGAFAVAAAAAGAERVTLVDSSGPALDLARRAMALNGYQRADYVEGDVFSVLRKYRAERRTFNVIVVDPPKLAASSREVERASRAYKDVNLLAFQLLQPGGILFTTSCSGAVSADLFQKIIFGAALDAGREAQIVGWLSQGSDHPVALTFPEGLYLKGLICRAL